MRIDTRLYHHHDAVCGQLGQRWRHLREQPSPISSFFLFFSPRSLRQMQEEGLVTEEEARKAPSLRPTLRVVSRSTPWSCARAHVRAHSCLNAVLTSLPQASQLMASLVEHRGTHACCAKPAARGLSWPNPSIAWAGVWLD